MNTTIQNNDSTTRSEWFDNLVAMLRTHELQLETNTAPNEMKELYGAMIGNDLDELFKSNKAITQKYFVGKIIVEYLKLLDKNQPLKLAFNYNDSEVLVWAEIEDNNELQENYLARAESKINAKFHPYGFDMETMIVEKSDNLPVPNHYIAFK